LKFGASNLFGAWSLELGISLARGLGGVEEGS
jgi:hypothetical protein